MLHGHYEKTVDRESAYEKLGARAASAEAEAKGKTVLTRQGAQPKSETTKLLEAMAKSAAHAVGSQIGRQIIRGVLGSLFGSGRRR
jgi:ATP-dependent DNA ligase